MIFPVLVQFTQVEKAPYVGRWDFRNVNWDLYCDLCASAVAEEAVFSGEDPAFQFTHLLTSTASKIIPKTQCKPRLPKVPWFTDKCKLAIKERKKAQRLVFRQPTSENILKYKQRRAKARYTIKNAKRSCWRQFCSNLNSKASSKTVWKAIRRLKVKYCPSSISHLLVDDHLIVTDKQSVASSLARCLADTSSSSHYAPMGSPSRGRGVSRLSLPTPLPSPIFVCPSAYRNLSPVLLFTHQLLPTYLQFSSLDCPFCLHRPFTYISLLYKPSFCHFSFSLWSTRDPAR